MLKYLHHLLSMYVHFSVRDGSHVSKFGMKSFFFFNLFQDRLTFRRIIVKNNAKKRRMYESFIETLPLLTSLEVNISFVQKDAVCIYIERLCQPSVL